MLNGSNWSAPRRVVHVASQAAPPARRDQRRPPRNPRQDRRQRGIALAAGAVGRLRRRPPAPSQPARRPPPERPGAAPSAAPPRRAAPPPRPVREVRDERRTILRAQVATQRVANNHRVDLLHAGIAQRGLNRAQRQLPQAASQCSLTGICTPIIDTSRIAILPFNPALRRAANPRRTRRCAVRRGSPDQNSCAGDSPSGKKPPCTGTGCRWRYKAPGSAGARSGQRQPPVTSNVPAGSACGG